MLSSIPHQGDKYLLLHAFMVITISILSYIHDSSTKSTKYFSPIYIGHSLVFTSTVLEITKMYYMHSDVYFIKFILLYPHKNILAEIIFVLINVLPCEEQAHQSRVGGIFFDRPLILPGVVNIYIFTVYISWVYWVLAPPSSKTAYGVLNLRVFVCNTILFFMWIIYSSIVLLIWIIIKLSFYICCLTKTQFLVIDWFKV